MSISEDEFKRAYNSLRSHKDFGFYEIHVTTIVPVCDQIKTTLLRIFNTSLKLVYFQKKMKKIEKVIPIFRSGKEQLLRNCRPVLFKNSIY